MIVRVHCPHPECGKRYKVDDAQLGQTTACKVCGRTFTLSAAGQETINPTAQSETGGTPPTQPPAAMPKQVGRFVIRARLGAGAFGAVYRAFDPVLEREVALKVPRAAALEKPEARARFLREPKAAAQLRHPHIVPVFDSGSDGDHYYIASAYIEGRTLEDLIDHQRPDFRGSAEIIRDLAGALQYAHGMGVVHRDVKPANIMIDARGQALLMDFGLARLERMEEKLTQDGSAIGTPAYMAPEQADGSFGEVGPASDQYSLGVVLYELLCGEPPFSGTPAVLLFNVLHQAPESPRSRNPQLPRDLETICLKAMAKRSADRYADCAAMAEDLRCWLADEPIRARRQGWSERAAKWARRNPAVAGLLATVCLAIGIGLLGVTWQWRRAESNWTLAEENLDEAQRQQRLAEESLGEVERQKVLAERLAEEAKKHQELAESRLAEVQRQRNATDLAQQAEKAERSKAETAQRAAEANAAETQAQRELAEERGRAARQNLYFSKIRLAAQAIEAGDISGACELVFSLVPEPDQEDLRSFDWYYLAGQSGVVTPRRFLKASYERVDPHNYSEPIAFSQNGKTLAFPEGDSIALWDAATWTHLGSLRGHAGKIKAVLVDPNGEKVVSASEDIFEWKSNPNTASWTRERVRVPGDHAIRIWDVATQKEIARIDQVETGSIKLSPDGKFIAAETSTPRIDGKWVGNRASALGLFDVASGKELGEFSPESSFSKWEFSFAPDSRRLALCDSGVSSSYALNLRVAIVDLSTMSKRPAIEIGNRAKIGGASFSPDGKTFLVEFWYQANPFQNSGHGTLRQYETATGQIRAERQYKTARRYKTAGDRLGHVLISPDSRTAALVDNEFVDLSNGALRALSKLPEKSKATGEILGFSLDSKRLITSECIVDVGTGKVVLRFDDSKLPGPAWCAALGEGRILARRYPGVVAIWGFDAVNRIDSIKTNPPAANCVAVSADGKTIAAAGKDEAVRLWDTSTGQEQGVLKNHSKWISALALSPDGTILASATQDESITLWDMATKKVRHTLKGSDGPINAIAFSPDGKSLASAGMGALLRVWDTQSGTLRTSWQGHRKPVLGVAFSPDGATVASVTDKYVYFWDPRTGAERGLISGIRDDAISFHCGVFSPDGKTLATAGNNGKITLWNLKKQEQRVTLAQRVTFAGHPKAVHALAFAPDGLTLVSASADASIKVWDVALAVERLTLRGHADAVRALAFTPDGSLLVSGSSDGKLQLWPASRGADCPAQLRSRFGFVLGKVLDEVSAKGSWNTFRGVTIDGILPGSPAAKTAICPGDILVQVDGRRVFSASNLLSYKEPAKNGSTIEVTVLSKDGVLHSHKIILEQAIERPAEAVEQPER